MSPNTPDIHHDRGTLWDAITLVLVVLGGSMRQAKDSSRKPAQSLLDAATDVW